MKIRGRIAGKKENEIRMILSDIKIVGHQFAVNCKELRRPGMVLFNAEICIGVDERRGLLDTVEETLEIEIKDGSINADVADIFFGRSRQAIFGDVASEAVLGWVSTPPGMRFHLEMISPIEAILLGGLEDPDENSINEIRSGTWASVSPSKGVVDARDIQAIIKP